MPFDGSSGAFSRLYDWTTDRDGAVKIEAVRMDAEMDGMATALSTTICKDGQSVTTAKIPFAVGLSLGNGSVSTPAINFTAETGTGLYYIGSSNFGWAVSGTKVLDIGAGTLSVVGASATTFTAGRLGSTTPGFQVDASTASCITGVKVTALATGNGVGVAAIGETDVTLKIDGKGAGTIRLGATSTGAVEFSRNAVPTASDGAALGTGSLMWSDAFFASGAVLNFNNGDATITHSAGALTFSSDIGIASGKKLNFNSGDVTVTHSSNTLTFAGASSGYQFDALVAPSSSGGAALGSTSLKWSNLFLAGNGVINFNSGNVTLTHTAGVLTANSDLTWAGTTWIAFTPTLSATVGTITSQAAVAGTYKLFGKLAVFQITATISTNGTASGVLIAQLPFTTSGNHRGQAYGVERNLSGKMLIGQMNQSAAIITITDYAGAYPGADSAVIEMSGVVEIT